VEFIAVLLLVAFSTALQGTVGFGFAVALTPLLALFIDPRDAVALTLLLGALVSVGLYFGHASKAPVRGVLPIVVGGLIGTPIGLAVLLAVEEQTLRLLIGAAVVAVAAANVVHGRLGEPRRAEIWPLGGTVGLISGAMRGSVGMPGPAVLLYQHYLGGSADEIRAQMFAYLLIFTPMATLIAAFAGVFTRDVLGLAVFGVVGVASGVGLASIARPRVNERWFGLITALVLFAAGGSAFVAAIVA
jgi:uncharacterized membrane protein YfcA